MRHQEGPRQIDVTPNVFARAATTPPSPAPSHPTSPAPSLAPSGPPSPAPSENMPDECVADANGFFGTFSADFLPVNYYYQVETVPEDSSLGVDILSTLERSVLESLLPVLFEEECIPTANSRSNKKHMNNRRRLAVIGGSTQPPDRALIGVQCPKKEDATNCFVVDGSMSLFGDSEGELQDDAERTRIAIRSAMDNGDFNKIHPRILRVAYINETLAELTETNSIQETTSNEVDSGSGTIPAYGWVLIALAPIVVFSAVFLYIRRKRKQRELGAFPIAYSPQDEIPMTNRNDDSILGISVQSPEAQDSRRASWSVIDTHVTREESNPSLGISPMPLQPPRVNSIVVGSSSDGAPWERLSLT